MELLGRDRTICGTLFAAQRHERGRPGATTRAPDHDDCKRHRQQAQFVEPRRPGLALATGKTQQEIAAACKGARPNPVGAALSRQKRAGRIEERDGKLYAIQLAETGAPQPAMPSSNLVGVALPDRHLAISPSRCRVMLFEVSFRPDRCHRLPGRARPCTIDTSDMGTPAHAWL